MLRPQSQAYKQVSDDQKEQVSTVLKNTTNGRKKHIYQPHFKQSDWSVYFRHGRTLNTSFLSSMLETYWIQSVM